MEPMRVGRNEACPCGSGKKFKRCHGALEAPSASVADLIVEAAGRRRQQQLEQGLGRPIISTKALSGHRVVAVGAQWIAGTWTTFHSFLPDYLWTVFGRDWCATELAKPLEQRHPAMQWHEVIRDQESRAGGQPGEVFHSTMNGAVGSFLTLAYDLYCLQHNAELQARLVARMKVPDQFAGARYEAQVAASFARAGFTIEFEDETDGGRSHCEFAATAPSGRRFSVECKRRSGQKGMRIGQLFNEAQRKQADHVRVVFIELAWLEPSRPPRSGELPACFGRAKQRLNELENSPLDGAPRPPCYVVLTNTPWDQKPSETLLPFAFNFSTFRLPHFGNPEAPPTHKDMRALFDSMRTHRTVPATFDGTPPHLAFPGARAVDIEPADPC
ncbi:SEC-C metal-binding domain-containing protein [Aquabacterium sp.]|uniref:SEC-C metal-binding domain-containing protein n=1 Tax=Aquabacterium sp. TaxID=1872578 RepID=UPI003784399E